MLINKKLEQDEIILKPEGRIDPTTVPILRDAIQNIEKNVTKVCFDFRDVNYISSAGLREILICRKKYQGDNMKIINVMPDIMEIFEVTGFQEIVPIELVKENEKPTYLNYSFKAFLKEKVKSVGDKIVLKDANNTYTWKEIDIASQIIAEELSVCGVKKGTHVGLCGSNSVNWIITFYAIQKLGGIAMLLNFNMNPSEIATASSVGDITHLCYGELPAMKDEDSFLDEIKSNQTNKIQSFISIKNILVYKNCEDKFKLLENKHSVEIDADYPCIAIFTSGSTGVPKAVLLSAYNILNAANENAMSQQLTSDDRTCLILPLFHVFGLVAGVFANAMKDSTIIIPKDIRTGTLIHTIEDEHCTVFHSVPTMMIALINNKEFDPQKCESLRCSILSGAAATPAQIEMFKKILPNNHFLASYGMSEMAPVTITDYEDTVEHVTQTVGKPMKHIKICIKDASTGNICQTGETGEILLQGYNLMIGYYKVALENQSLDEEGWLHSGDLGFLDEDGYLHLNGRMKELIIRGGENIMPGEIASVISKLECIDDVKVVGVPSDFYGEEVCACVKIKEGFEFSEADAKARLANELAKFKIPSYFIVYDKFPLLASGKVDSVGIKKDAEEKVKEKICQQKKI